MWSIDEEIDLRILITGGAGFIGSHLADALVAAGHEVVVFDNLDPQVHGPGCSVPTHLAPGASFVQGDVRNRTALAGALVGVQAVYHLAAQTGVGQSMYQIERYVETNIQGTAVLLDLLASGTYPVEKLILASSRAVYGEGAYKCALDGPVYPSPRALEQLEHSIWDPACPVCGGNVQPTPTSEDAPHQPSSVYALSKSVQESLCHMISRTYGLTVTTLRYFNVYGARQSLSNPYTGVLSIFSSIIKNGRVPEIYEDGLESRDFVHVRDVVQANLLALERQGCDGQAINVGSGQRLTILEIASTMLQAFGMQGEPRFGGRFRVGDVRHCFADISLAHRLLGYTPQVAFEEGLRDFLAWALEEDADDLIETAKQELAVRKLFR